MWKALELQGKRSDDGEAARRQVRQQPGRHDGQRARLGAISLGGAHLP